MNMKEIFILLLDLCLVFCVQTIRGEIQISILFYPSTIAFPFICLLLSANALPPFLLAFLLPSLVF